MRGNRGRGTCLEEFNGSQIRFPAVLEPVTLSVHLQEVDVMSETIEGGSRQSSRAEDLCPFVEG